MESPRSGRVAWVDVIVIGFQGERWLPECLESLQKAVGGGCRIVLVDNGGNGDVSEFGLDSGSSVVLRTPRRMGFAEANNFALQQVGLESQAVCFLNQDTLSEPGWLEACLECLTEHPDVGAVSPLLRNYDDTGWDSGFLACAGKSDRLLAIINGQAGGDDFFEVPRVTAAAMVVRSDVLREVGPFDPIYGSYYEDYDLCLRIRRAGFRVGVCTRGTVRHYSGSSTTSEEAEHKRMLQVIRNRAILRFREAGVRRMRSMLSYFAATFPWNLVRGICRTPSSQPVRVQLAAHASLLSELPRLASAQTDAEEWQRYLKDLGCSRKSGEPLENAVAPMGATD